MARFSMTSWHRRSAADAPRASVWRSRARVVHPALLTAADARRSIPSFIVLPLPQNAQYAPRSGQVVPIGPDRSMPPGISSFRLFPVYFRFRLTRFGRFVSQGGGG